MGLTSGRLAAYGAIILSTFTVIINIVCVPLLINRITQMKIQIENGMERYKVRI